MESMAGVKPKVSAILKGAPRFAALTDTEIESLAGTQGGFEFHGLVVLRCDFSH